MATITEEHQGAAGKGRLKGRAGIVQKAIGLIEERLNKGTMQATVTDLIRLLQLEREMGPKELPRIVEVKWKEPVASSSK